MTANTRQKLSRRRLLALPAAGVAVALPAAAAIADAEPLLLADVIGRHRAAAAALDGVCARLDRIERRIAERYPAEVCRSWLRGGASARSRWPRIRKAHGIERLEHERRTLDAAEEALALELLACPCATVEEVRLKARYVGEAEIMRENLMRDQRFVDALLLSLAG